jgi:hypothetical protein
MIYSTFASDLLPAAGAVAESAILWFGGALMVVHLCALCLATNELVKNWRRRALIQ